MEDLISQFNNILPLACKWAESQETLMSEKGNLLSPELLSYASKAGVINPKRVHILVVPKIPIPKHPILSEACKTTQLITPQTAGLTLRYGIYIRSDCAKNRGLYVHELVHVAQYERLGGIQQFLQQYLHEVVTMGYPNAPLEQEAIKIAKDMLGLKQ